MKPLYIKMTVPGSFSIVGNVVYNQISIALTP